MPPKRRSLIIIVFSIEIVLLIVSSIFLFSYVPPVYESSVIENVPKNPFFRIKPKESEISNYTRSLIKSSFLEYYKYCRNSDYLKPMTKRCDNSSGLSLTMFDSLDALYVAGLKEEFDLAKNYIMDHVFPDNSDYINTYELCTRVIGGLISIYSLTGDTSFYNKAIPFADLMLKAFDKGPIPNAFVDGKRGKAVPLSFTEGTFLSESSGILLEFSALHEISGNPKYRSVVEKYVSCFASQLPNLTIGQWSTKKCEPIGDYAGLTSLTASFYANILKKQLAFPSNETRIITRKVINILSNIRNRAIPNDVDKYSDFSESFCELNSLIELIDNNTKHEGLEKACNHMRSFTVPLNGRNFIDWNTHDDDQFNYDSSMFSEDWNRTVSMDVIKNCECGKAICSIASQKQKKMSDMMPSNAISKWLKFILLNGANEQGHMFVINDAGHFIPIQKHR